MGLKHRDEWVHPNPPGLDGYEPLDKRLVAEAARRDAEEKEKEILRSMENIAIMDSIHNTLTSDLGFKPGEPSMGPCISGRKMNFDQLPQQIQERYVDPSRICSIRFYLSEKKEWYYIRTHNLQRFVHKWGKEGRQWTCRVIDISENEAR